MAAISMLASTPIPESPFACDRTAFTREQRKRRVDDLGTRLRALVVEARELPDGYEFKFPADAATYQLIAEWAGGEHLCCPFFGINIRLDREGGTTWIRLTSRPGTKEFIRQDFKRWFKQ